MKRSRRRLPNSGTRSDSLKTPSFGSEEAHITRDDSGDAIGDARIIGIGGESGQKE